MRLNLRSAVLLWLATLIVLICLQATAQSSRSDGLSISGVKFDDRNGDGFLDDGEPVLPGWTIRLTGRGAPLEAVTDSFGRYLFTGLGPGRYVLAEEPRPGWTGTIPGCGSFEVTLTDRSADNLNFGDISESRASSQAELSQNTLMHLSREDLRAWSDTYRTLPRARIDPDLQTIKDTGHGEEFSLLKYLQYCPKERNQLRCGNCWVWTCTGIVEIELAAKTGIRDRLSVQYISSLLGGCRGGSLELFSDVIKRTGRVIPWSNANAQWQDGPKACADGSCVSLSTISTDPSYPVISAKALAIPTVGIGKEAAIRNIKNVLRQKKPVFFSMLLPTNQDARTFQDIWGKGFESRKINIDYACGKPINENEASAHAVLCVGYNDTDPDNRYWIMLNSWGVSPGRRNGLFLVDMDMDYDGTYQSPEGSYQTFIWGTLDVTFPDSLKAELPGSGMYRSLGSMNGTGIGIPQSPSSSGAANAPIAASKAVWRSIENASPDISWN